MTDVIGTGSALVAVVVAGFLMRTRSSTLANRVALILFVLAGFGFIVTAFGRTVHGLSVGATRSIASWLHGQGVGEAASMSDLLLWVATGIVVAAGLWVVRGVVYGDVSVLLAVAAVAFPTLLFYEGGPVAEFATEAFRGLSGVLGEFWVSARSGFADMRAVMAKTQ